MKCIQIVLALALALGLGTAAHALETARITNIGHGYWAAPLYIAQRTNLFAKHGLELDTTSVKGGSISLQTALTKQADVAMVTFEHVLKAASKGKRLVSIFRFVKIPMNSLLANNKVINRLKGQSVGARIRGLKGLRIGLPSAGGSGEKMLMVLANKYGLKLQGNVQTVYLGGNPGAYVAAFKRNLIDAAMMFEPTGVFLQEANLGSTLVDLMRGEEPMFNDVLFLTLTTHPDYLTQKAGLLRKIAAVFTDAMEFIHDQPDKGKAIMALEFPSLSKSANSKVYDNMLAVWSRNGRMDEGQARRTMAYMGGLGGLKVGKDFSPSRYFSNDMLPR